MRVCFLCRVVCQCRCRLACEFFFVRVLAATRGGGSMDYSRESAYRSQMSGDERGESLSAESYSEKHLSRIDEWTLICCEVPANGATEVCPRSHANALRDQGS